MINIKILIHNFESNSKITSNNVALNNYALNSTKSLTNDPK
jgi:hypothetical protein